MIKDKNYSEYRMNKSNKIKNIAIMGMMVAILEVVKFALMAIPNVELVTLMIIIFTLLIGRKAFIVVTAFSLIECVIWGFGLWSIGYFYVWPILVIVTLIFRKNTNSFLWAIIAGFFGLFFGALFAITYIFTSGFEAATAYWISGIPFDLLHCISNFVLTLVAFKPLYTLISKLKNINL